MPTGPARSGRPDDRLRVVEGAPDSTFSFSSQEDRRGLRPFHRANARSPFPAFAGQES